MKPNRKEYYKQYYQQNKEKILNHSNSYYQENKNKVINNWVERKYKINQEQYHTMLTEREYKCDICQDIMTKPHIDHCHISGKVRGILCSRCNTALGKFKDDVNKLQRAIDYLNKNK